MESKLELDQIKSSLLILRQHNLILLEERGIEKSERKIIEYSIHLSFLLARIRFPKYILLARERFGLEGETIFEQILLWGQLTIEKTVNSLVPKEERRAKDNLQKIFQKMINDSFVSDVSIIDSSRSKESNLNYNFVLDGNSSSTVFWRINFNRCNILIRNEACVDLIREKLGIAQANIIQSAFRTIESSLKLNQEDSQNFTVDQLLQMVKKADELQMIRYLDSITSTNPPFLSKISGEGRDSTYVIHISKMIQTIKQRIIESVVHHRFGLLSARIFRLLTQRKYLEQKTIATLTLTPVKESRTRLYEMLSENYVSVQELLKNGMRNNWLWYVRLDSVSTMLKSDMYKGVFNARKRLEMHMNEAKIVMERNIAFPEDISSFSEPDRRLLSKAQYIQEQLQTSIIQLDQTVLLLSID
eukprot:TRINITY_DN5266_c0_g1_i3.p1 TRINITY_DN5266_c0_g1~~TRINITY_DN5266_c0_g1_i3.p1  ORF type:complete len:416 (-),score=70.73 TRINITY_DN5266_c0_g1_i3:163-1410(-)